MTGNRTLLPNVVLATVMLGIPLYVLSYAPVARSSMSSSGMMWVDGQHVPAYRPLDWIIDNTPLRRPLLWWAGMWGVRDAFELSSLIRRETMLRPSELIEASNPGSVILDL